MAKKWKWVVGFENRYQVSDHGEVRRLLRIHRSKPGRAVRLVEFTPDGPGESLYAYKAHPTNSVGFIEYTPLAPFLSGGRDDTCRYPIVRLYHAKGDFVTKAVHRLVLETFVGPCPEKMQCCHNDGNPQNNHLSNLRWDSPKENAADRGKHGTQPKGSKSSKAKLKEEHIPEIRFLLKYFNKRGNMTIIAQRFGVDVATIRDVRDRITWQQIPDPVYTTSQISRECPNCNRQTTHTLHSTTNTNYDVCFCDECDSFKFNKDEFYQEPFRDAIIVRKTTASHRGASTPNSKLTEEQVKEIRQKRKDGELLTTLAEEYKVSVPSISGICTGRTWTHVLS